MTMKIDPVMTTHMGHPTYIEELTATVAQGVATIAVARLVMQGFTKDQAIGFLAGSAYELAHRQGESWSNPSNARRTVMGVLSGRAGKAWALKPIADVARSLIR